ncbi:2OG-Fe(II) oxygenase [Allopusillimonas ginsengisoli]|nr:2OG-Fe(II) oxygenase [Allopusillimonas ginsengisoli]
MQLYLASRYAWRQGFFHEAQIGSPDHPIRNLSIRGDTIHWLDQNNAIQGCVAFQRWADNLQLLMNRHFFLGLRRSEFHFARYDKGLGYRQHMDQHRGQPHRKISLVLYLNRTWHQPDGGELCLYAPGDKTREIRRILPQFGRVVLFRSDLIPHAVLPCNRPRWSLTGWFRTDSLLLDTIVASPASNDDPFPGATPSGAAA